MVQFTSNPFACGCQKCRQGDLLLPVLVEMHMDIAEVSVEVYKVLRLPRKMKHFVRACAVEMRVDISQEPFHARIFNEHAPGQELEKLAAQTLCEPAQLKRMSTFHKSQFVRKFTGKRRESRVSTLIKHRPLQLP
jgi:hypothetical protein